MQNRLFDLASPFALLDTFAAPPKARSLWTLDADAVRETEHGFDLSIDLPGVDPASIDVAVEGSVLSVRADRKPRFEPKEGEAKARPQRYARQFDFQVAIDPANVKATLDQGVLSIFVSKADVAKRVKVPVLARESGPTS